MNEKSQLKSGIGNNDLTEQTIGDYRIERLLGRGGFGSVYLARDLQLDRSVAIKVIGGDQSPAFSDDAFQRFMREARTIASVDHPNIVQIHRVGRENDISYIVMQYIKGQTLCERLRLNGPVSIADALLITIQVARGLEAAHKTDLVHRDIKPENVMIDTKGHVKVMDFGLARTSSPDMTITQTGIFIGTPGYSSPEQCITTSIDCRSDLYSLGVILYEMLAGIRPHDADTPLALMNKIVQEPPPPIHERNPNVPGDIVAITERLLAKSPDDRYASAKELIDDLNDSLNRLKEDSAQTYQPTIQMPTEEYAGTIPIISKKSLWLKVAAALLLFVLIGLGLGILIPGEENGLDKPPQPKNIMGDNKVILAVYDFSNTTDNPDMGWLELGVPDMLAANLGQYKYIDLQTRDQILWKLNPQPKRFDDHMRLSLLPMEIQLVVKGSIYIEKKQLRFVVHVYDLKQNKSLGSVIQVGSVDTIFASVDKLAAQISDLAATFASSENQQVLLAASDRNEKESRQDTIMMTEDLLNQRLLQDLSQPKQTRALSAPAVFARKREGKTDVKAKAGVNKKKVIKERNGIREKKIGIRAQTVIKAQPPTDGSKVEMQSVMMDAKKNELSLKEISKDNAVDNQEWDENAEDKRKKTSKKLDQNKLLSDEVLAADATAELGTGGASKKGFNYKADFAPQKIHIILPYYYRGRQRLFSTRLTREKQEAMRKDLMKNLRSSGNNPKAVEAAYLKWEKSLTK